MVAIGCLRSWQSLATRTSGPREYRNSSKTRHECGNITQYGDNSHNEENGKFDPRCRIAQNFPNPPRTAHAAGSNGQGELAHKTLEAIRTGGKLAG